MNDNPKNNGNSNGELHASHDPNANLHLAFNGGHSSIGWAVIDAAADAEVLGCDSVIFRADDCLVSDRRAFRRQRRHIRSTRQRIARLKILLRHLGVLTEAEFLVFRWAMVVELFTPFHLLPPIVIYTRAGEA